MGYELNRFIDEIDDEFQCSSCIMVLKDPVQTPCEHTFCRNCIKDWLLINQTCPVDRKPLTISDVKPASRPFRNLWNKLVIKCDFEAKGCTKSSKLENLALHVSSCEYNLIICDKGCNMTITRREYNIDNCFSHLAKLVNAQEKEIIKVRQEFSDQKEDFERKVKEFNYQKVDFERKVSYQQVDITKLNDEIKGQHEKIRKLNDELSYLRRLEWQVCYNVNINETNILKVDDPAISSSYVTSRYRLEPGKSKFKVKILNIDIAGELSCIGLTENSEAGYFLRYFAGRGIFVSTSKICDVNWKTGDIIECGVTFHNSTVYISRNEKIIFNKSFTIPTDGFYPMIWIHGKDTRLQYFQYFQ